MSRHAISRSIIACIVCFANIAAAQTTIELWHSMPAQAGAKLLELSSRFNNSQTEFRLAPLYKGSYADSMTAALAARQAGKAPHILQVTEIGTATMMATKGVVKPVFQVMKDAGLSIDSKAYFSAIAGYYTDKKGDLLSFPFNSSTAVLYVNKDALRKAGLDSENVPRTWKDFVAATAGLKSSGHTCPYISTAPWWIHMENFSAWHDLPLANRENGFGGMDSVFKIDSPQHVQHIEMLSKMARNGAFHYSRRNKDAESRFHSGECAMFTASSGAQADIRRNAKFDWSVHFLPYHDDIKGAPRNTIIGGASLWVMEGKEAASYKGVARVLAFLAKPEIQMDWHIVTGYLPITMAAHELTRKSGYYDKNPGSEVAIRQLFNKQPTVNSRGLRFGDYLQCREIFESELDLVFSGKKEAAGALADAARRGNEVLRHFEAGIRREISKR